MAESLKRKHHGDDEVGVTVKKVKREYRPIPPPDPEELRISARKVFIAIVINPEKPCDNIWDVLPLFFQERSSKLEHWQRVREHKVKFDPVLHDMMSFGICTCNNRPEWKEHHPRNVLVNWRYKVIRQRVVFFYCLCVFYIFFIYFLVWCAVAKVEEQCSRS